MAGVLDNNLYAILKEKGESMPDIEERVESLETLLGRFILHTGMA